MEIIMLIKHPKSCKPGFLRAHTRCRPPLNFALLPEGFPGPNWSCCVARHPGWSLPPGIRRRIELGLGFCPVEAPLPLTASRAPGRQTQQPRAQPFRHRKGAEAECWSRGGTPGQSGVTDGGGGGRPKPASWRPLEKPPRGALVGGPRLAQQRVPLRRRFPVSAPGVHLRAGVRSGGG